MDTPNGVYRVFPISKRLGITRAHYGEFGALGQGSSRLVWSIPLASRSYIAVHLVTRARFSAQRGSCTRPATADQDQQRTPMSLPRRARPTGARPDRRRGSQAASSNSSCRSIRAGAFGGARDGRPTPARYPRTEAPSVRAAIIFIVPPQAGHTVTSIWNNVRGRS